MDIDEIFVKIGEFGFRQKLCVFFILCGQICSALHMVYMAFAGRPSYSFACKIDAQHSGNSKHDPSSTVIHGNESLVCSAIKSGKCSEIEFNDDWSSIASEWSLICDQSYKIQLVQAIFMFGNMIGCFFWGFIADAYGRLRTIFATIFLVCLFSFLTEFCNSYNSFAILRFGTGFALAGHGTATFVLATELIGPSYRSIVGLLVNSSFAVGIAVLVLLDLTSSTWQDLTRHVSIVNVIIFLTYIMLPESPRWLMSKNRVSDCKTVLSKIARSNGSSFDMNSVVIRLNASSSPKISKTDNKSSVLNVFKNSLTCEWTLIQMFVWFTTSAVYYGLTMAGDSLHSDLRLSVLLSGLVELPGYIIVTKLITRYQRKQLLLCLLIITSLACFLVKFCHEIKIIHGGKLHFAMIGKLCVSIIFAIIYVYSLELFPTLMRNSGFGLCTASARLGSVLTPFIGLLDKRYPSQQFVVFGCLFLLSVIFVRRLPETKDYPLPETLADLISLSELQKKVKTDRKHLTFI